MERAADIVSERRRLASRYFEALGDLEWLQLPPQIDGFQHGFQSFACLFEPGDVRQAVDQSNARKIREIGTRRNAWMESLQQSGVSTRPATHAVTMLAFYRQKYEIAPLDFPRAFAANECSISLPLFHGMTEAEQLHVIDLVRAGPN